MFLDMPRCDILIEQVPPVDTWGTEVVTIPLITRSADIVKCLLHKPLLQLMLHVQTSVAVRLPVILVSPSRSGFRELDISDYTLIQCNNPIGVFQFSRSYVYN